jgi:hypothetical protein
LLRKCKYNCCLRAARDVPWPREENDMAMDVTVILGALSLPALAACFGVARAARPGFPPTLKSWRR